jgi:hypothetical protein
MGCTFAGVTESLVWMESLMNCVKWGEHLYRIPGSIDLHKHQSACWQVTRYYRYVPTYHLPDSFVVVKSNIPDHYPSLRFHFSRPSLSDSLYLTTTPSTDYTFARGCHAYQGASHDALSEMSFYFNEKKFQRTARGSWSVWCGLVVYRTVRLGSSLVTLCSSHDMTGGWIVSCNGLLVV